MAKRPKKTEEFNEEGELVVEDAPAKNFTLEKEFLKWGNTAQGARTIFMASDAQEEDRPRIPTRIFAFDYASGGGFPVYSIPYLFGPEWGGKTTTTYSAIGAMQNTCMKCYSVRQFCKCNEGPTLMSAFYNAVEGDIDYDWAVACGVDLKRLVVGEPNSGEEAANQTYKALQAYNCGMIVVDSIAAFVPESEFADKAAYSQEPGTQARLISKFIRRVRAQIQARKKAQLPIIVILTNQIREKIGVMWGSSEQDPCGHALKHQATMRVRFSKISLDPNERKKYDVDGLELVSKHKFKIIKSRVRMFQANGEFLRAVSDLPEVSLKFGQIKDQNTVLKLAQKYGVVDGEGPYSIPTQSLHCNTQKELLSLWNSKPEYYFDLQQRIFREKRKELEEASNPGKDKGDAETTVCSVQQSEDTDS